MRGVLRLRDMPAAEAAPPNREVMKGWLISNTAILAVKRFRLIVSLPIGRDLGEGIASDYQSTTWKTRWSPLHRTP